MRGEKNKNWTRGMKKKKSSKRIDKREGLCEKKGNESFEGKINRHKSFYAKKSDIKSTFYTKELIFILFI